MDKIGVFCSASANLPALYVEAARQLGEWIGRNHKTLVYGGSHLGLMGVVGKSVHENGGQLFGMVPMFLDEIGGVEPELNVTFSCAGLTDRKDLMLLESEVLVALPGGIGTLDEVFTTMGMRTVEEKQKKVVFLNLNGFWNPIIEFLYSLRDKGMLRHPLEEYFEVADSVEELIDIIKD